MAGNGPIMAGNGSKILMIRKDFLEKHFSKFQNSGTGHPSYGVQHFLKILSLFFNYSESYDAQRFENRDSEIKHAKKYIYNKIVLLNRHTESKQTRVIHFPLFLSTIVLETLLSIS